MVAPLRPPDRLAPAATFSAAVVAPVISAPSALADVTDPPVRLTLAAPAVEVATIAARSTAWAAPLLTVTVPAPSALMALPPTPDAVVVPALTVTGPAALTATMPLAFVPSMMTGPVPAIVTLVRPEAKMPRLPLPVALITPLWVTLAVPVVETALITSAFTPLVEAMPFKVTLASPPVALAAMALAAAPAVLAFCTVTLEEPLVAIAVTALPE